MQNNLQDLAIRRQVLLERLKSGQVENFKKAFRELEALTKQAFAGLSGPLLDLKKRETARFLAELETDIRKALTGQTDLYIRDLEEVAGIYATTEAADLVKVTSGPIKLKVPKKAALMRNALTRPMGHSGELLKEFVGQIAGKESSRVVNTIRKGVTQGRTNQELIRSVIGTKARNFRDGVLATSRRNADAVVRTATQHVASSARQDLWEANPETVQGYQWVSTLDRKTTNLCKSLDGRKFKVGEGPTPPIHIRCRSTTIATLDPKFDFLQEGRTRSAEFGPTKGDENYFDWLKRQPPEFQDQALGKARAKLFRDGGLSPDEFSRLQLDKNFRPLTLEEMRQLEPEVFKKAFPPKPKVIETPPRDFAKITKEIASSPEWDKALKAREEADHLFKIAYPGSSGTGTDLDRALWMASNKTANQLRREALEGVHKRVELPKVRQGDPSKVVVPGVLNAPKNVNRQRLGYMDTTATEASEFVSRVVDKDYLPQGIRMQYKPERNHYWKGEVFVNIDTSTRVMAHEIIHDIEFKHSGVAAKTRAFLNKRAGGQPTKKLSKLTGDKGYKPHEIAFEDEWAKRGGSHYMGKDYSQWYEATELLTMGVERLMFDPVSFARQDPEYFEFLLEVFQTPGL